MDYLSKICGVMNSAKLTVLAAIAIVAAWTPTVLWAASADYDDEDDARPRWSIAGQFGGSSNVVSRNTAEENASHWDMSTSLTAEYYFSGSKLSLLGGVAWENYSFLHGDLSEPTTQLRLGGRWYPMAYSSWFNPYVGADVLSSFEHKASSSWMSAESQSGTHYRREFTHRPPLFSVGPVVGFELRLFSSVHLTVDYSYRMGIDGHTRAVTTGTRYYEGEMSSRLSRHVIMGGLKLTFPFRFTQSDSNNLFDDLWELLFPDPRRNGYYKQKLHY